MTWMTLKLMSWLGLVKDLRLPRRRVPAAAAA
jgi:hypothetical protein